MSESNKCPNCGAPLEDFEPDFCMSCDALLFTDEKGVYAYDSDGETKIRYEDFIEAKCPDYGDFLVSQLEFEHDLEELHKKRRNSIPGSKYGVI